MRWFWTILILPLLDAMRPSVVVEVGAESGVLTRLLLDWGSSHDVVVHSIDPRPQFDPTALAGAEATKLRFHRARSLPVLGEIGHAQLVLIDGDHNWYTVNNELRTIEQRAAQDNVPPPVILLHDVDWPYGRRDMYYDPETVPAQHRQPHAKRGVVPDEDELGEPGLNDHLDNALHEGGRANGVLTAIEEYVEGSELEWQLFRAPGLHGLGALAPAQVLVDNARVSDVLGAMTSPAFLTAQCDAIEAERIRAEVQRNRVVRELAEIRGQLDQSRNTSPTIDEDELLRLRDALARETAARAEADESVTNAQRLRERTARKLEESEGDRVELDRELDRRSSELRGARRELVQSAMDLEAERGARAVAEEAQRVASGRLSAQIDERRAAGEELERLQGELRSLRDQLQRSEQRRVDDLQRAATDATQTTARLEAELDELRGQDRDARQREQQLRGEIEALHVELVTSISQSHRLQSALSRARVDAEIASGDREALDRRLLELSAQSQPDALEQANPGPRSDDVFSDLLAELRGIDAGGDGPRGGEARAEAAAAAPTTRTLSAPVQSHEATNGSPSPEREAPVASPPAWTPLAEPERVAQAMFLSMHGRMADEPGEEGAPDPMALPSPLDRRNVLAHAGEDQEPGQPTVDVVVCVHNALDDLRRCLWSLVAKTNRRFHLILVNDGSAEPATEFLADFAKREPAVELIHRPEPPHGYTIAANLGLRASASDYVVLLNSDTMVTPEWLRRIVDQGERDQRIGVLGPLSNAASHQSVPELRHLGSWATNPLPEWLTEDAVAMILARVAPRRDARLPFLNGFCYVIKRAVLDAVGYLDEENFASGYCEENDFSQRARVAGFELAVVDNAYVYHAKSKSFGIAGRSELAKRNYQIFLDKHGPAEIQQLVHDMESDATLAAVRAAVADAMSSPADLAAALASTDRPPLSVVFILPGLGDGGSGGSHSIYQEVRGLRQLGIPARIALFHKAWKRARAAYDDAEDVFETFTDERDLIGLTADADVISATHFKSVAMLAAIRAARGDFLPTYYIQDYEPFFVAADDADSAEARASYTAVRDALLFAKTHWLCNTVAERHGVYVAKVEPSLDEQLFRPQEAERDRDRLHVTAMVRPRTPRRQPFSTVAVLERLLHDFPGAVDVTVFGCHHEQLEKITRSPAILERNRGILKRQEVARLLARSDVLLDMSMYQAFGRTALEAMACGATAVVPRVGGVWEFTEQGSNAIAVDTLDRAAAFAALASMVSDPDRVTAMRRRARATAARYSTVRAALSEYLVFDNAYRARFG